MLRSRSSSGSSAWTPESGAPRRRSESGPVRHQRRSESEQEHHRRRRSRAHHQRRSEQAHHRQQSEPGHPGDGRRRRTTGDRRSRSTASDGRTRGRGSISVRRRSEPVTRLRSSHRALSCLRWRPTIRRSSSWYRMPRRCRCTPSSCQQACACQANKQSAPPHDVSVLIRSQA